MKSKDLLASYGYSKTRWDHFKKMGRSNNFLVFTSVFITSILLSPFYSLINYYLHSYVSKYKFENSTSFCFTVNHMTVVDKLRESSYKNVNVGIGESYFSNRILFLFLFNNYNLLPNLWTILIHKHLRFNVIKALKTIAISNLFEVIFKNNCIKNVIQFNDHGPLNFDLYRQSKLHKAKSIYIQHAPVTKEFPALYHDVNILFSQDSLDKYCIEKSEIKVILNRDFRFPKVIKKKSKNPLKIVLCPNVLDIKGEVINTYEVFKNAGYYVLLRKHPADRRSFPASFNLSDNIVIWDDLIDSQFVITNESAVTLEGLYINCLCYKYIGWSDSIDAYGFVSKGLIKEEIKDQNALLSAIQSKKITTDISKLTYFIGDQTKHFSLTELLDV